MIHWAFLIPALVVGGCCGFCIAIAIVRAAARTGDALEHGSKFFRFG